MQLKRDMENGHPSGFAVDGPRGPARKVQPGAVSEMAFVARATGRFSVEEHKPDAKGGHSHGEAALVRIEVLP